MKWWRNLPSNSRRDYSPNTVVRPISGYRIEFWPLLHRIYVETNNEKEKQVPKTSKSLSSDEHSSIRSVSWPLVLMFLAGAEEAGWLEEWISSRGEQEEINPSVWHDPISSRTPSKQFCKLTSFHRSPNKAFLARPHSCNQVWTTFHFRVQCSGKAGSYLNIHDGRF